MTNKRRNKGAKRDDKPQKADSQPQEAQPAQAPQTCQPREPAVPVAELQGLSIQNRQASRDVERGRQPEQTKGVENPQSQPYLAVASTSARGPRVPEGRIPTSQPVPEPISVPQGLSQVAALQPRMPVFLPPVEPLQVSLQAPHLGRAQEGVVPRKQQLAVAVPALPAAGSGLRPPPRPGTGTQGRPIKLLANHFLMKIQPRDAIFHYDVDVKNDKGREVINKKLLRTLLYELSTKHNRNELYPCAPVFDGRKNIYTAKEFNFRRKEFRVEYKDENRDTPSIFLITIKFASRIVISSSVDAYLKAGSTNAIPQDAIQALDVVLRYSLSNRFVPVGRCLVSETFDKVFDIGEGSELWFGHFQSLRLGWKPFVNIDASQKAFLKAISVEDFMWEVLGEQRFYNPNPRDLDEFGRKLRGVKVRYQRGPLRMSYKVNGLGKPPSQEMFEHNGQMVSVKDYLLKQYRVTLKQEYAHLPCLWVGSVDRRVHVPMEAGQPNNKKLSDTQTASMIRATAVRPHIRRDRIVKSFQQSLNLSNDYYAQQYGLTFDSQMVKIQGRVLDAPKLEYDGSSFTPKDGAWDMRGRRFLRGTQLKTWGIISVDRIPPQAISNFATRLATIGRDTGINIDPPLFIEACQDHTMEKIFRGVKNKHPDLQIVCFVIRKKGDLIYKEIKRIGDLDLNITTQCVQGKNVIKCDPATLSNICLKLNAKLGGVNNFIDKSVRPAILNQPFIIMGADVTHPSADQRQEGIPSVAAVVASMNPSATQYGAEIRLQEARQEALVDLNNITYKLLMKFFQINKGVKPKRIIFYRDGVSEGQFQQVLREELTAVRAACTRLEADYKPPITFLVVQKRHKTRLFAEDDRDKGRSGNVPPGTIVDTVITHPTEHDYFLVSHVGIQGTSRPTHYHVLWDDYGFTADDLQKLTYYLCHVFSRCTRSVSNPAPSYYAHLLAFRGRMYYDSLVQRDRGQVREEHIKAELAKASNLQHMFFV